MPPLQMCVSTLLIAGVNGTDAMQARPNTFLETGAGNASVSTPHCSRVWAGSGPGLGHRHGKTWVGNAVMSPFTYAMLPTATEHTEGSLWKKTFRTENIPAIGTEFRSRSSQLAFSLM